MESQPQNPEFRNDACIKVKINLFLYCCRHLQPSYQLAVSVNT